MDIFIYIQFFCNVTGSYLLIFFTTSFRNKYFVRRSFERTRTKEEKKKKESLDRMYGFGAPRAPSFFEQRYLARSYIDVGRYDLENTDKIILPESSSAVLFSMELTYPMTFSIKSEMTELRTHGGGKLRDTHDKKYLCTTFKFNLYLHTHTHTRARARTHMTTYYICIP